MVRTIGAPRIKLLTWSILNRSQHWLCAKALPMAEVTALPARLRQPTRIAEAAGDWRAGPYEGSVHADGDCGTDGHAGLVGADLRLEGHHMGPVRERVAQQAQHV